MYTCVRFGPRFGRPGADARSGSIPGSTDRSKLGKLLISQQSCLAYFIGRKNEIVVFRNRSHYRTLATRGSHPIHARIAETRTRACVCVMCVRALYPLSDHDGVLEGQAHCSCAVHTSFLDCKACPSRGSVPSPSPADFGIIFPHRGIDYDGCRHRPHRYGFRGRGSRQQAAIWVGTLPNRF